MKLNGHELEMKYLCYIDELQKIRDGFYGRNIWLFVVRIYFKTSLLVRLIRLFLDKQKRLIDNDAYVTWNNMIKNAL